MILFILPCIIYLLGFKDKPSLIVMFVCSCGLISSCEGVVGFCNVANKKVTYTWS